MFEFQYFQVDPDFFEAEIPSEIPIIPTGCHGRSFHLEPELHLLHGLLPLDGAARGEHHRGACFGQAQRGLAAQALTVGHGGFVVNISAE